MPYDEKMFGDYVDACPTNQVPTKKDLDKVFNTDGFIQLHEMAFIKNNFLTNQLCEDLVSDMLNGEYTIYNNNELRFYDTEIRESVKSLIAEISNDSINSAGFVFCHTPKDILWGNHRDATAYDYQIEGMHLWGGVIYLTDFEGGDIVYPEYGVKYHAKKGDLVFHGGQVLHHVEPVKSSDRYTITFYLWKNKV